LNPGFFLPGNAPGAPHSRLLHRLHPLTKLVFSLACISIIFGGPDAWLCALFPGVLALLLLWGSGISGQAYKTMLRLLLPLAVVLFLVHGLFSPQNRTIILRLGPAQFGQEGLLYAALILLRLFSALAASLTLLLSTHPAHLILALTQSGLSPQLAYLLGSPLLLLPQMAARIGAIQAAQQSRGLETQGSLLQRAQALFPLVAPLVYSSLVDVEEHALALEVRGFSAPQPKTSLLDLPDSAAQHIFRWGMVGLALLLLSFSLTGRVFGSR